MNLNISTDGLALLCFALVICYLGLATVFLLVALMLRDRLDRQARELREELESQRATLRDLELVIVRDPLRTL